jgi:drug/metabolite transporter (DMT)-like permease
MKRACNPWKISLTNNDSTSLGANISASTRTRDSSKSQPWVGRLQIVAAAVLWSTSGLFVKSDWFDAWPKDSRGIQIAFWRAAFGFFLLIPFIRKWTWHWIFIPMGIAFVTMVATFMTAMVLGAAANAIWLQYLAPAWVVLYSFAFERKSPSRADLRMLLWCLSGVLLILIVGISGGTGLPAIGFGIASGVAYAAVVVMIRSLPEVDSALLITVNHAATILLLAPWALQADMIQPSAYFALAFFGLVQMSIPYVLFARGLRTTSSTEASILTLIEPVILPMWVYLAWGNHPEYQAPHWSTLLGGGLILVGLLNRYLPALWRGRPTELPPPSSLE